MTKKGKVTGIGGVFFKTEDPKATKDWYKNNLGFNNEPELLETINQKDEAEFTIYYSTGTRQQTNIHKKSINRDCMYRGIHQLICEVRNKDNKLIFRDIVNVPIE